MKSLQMQSCVHEEGTIECALFEVDIASPKDNEVMVKIEASPINPSDLGLMFGAADVGSIRASERNGHPSIVLDVPAPAMRAMATRVGEWLPVGNEACGTVVEAGASPEAQALLGKRVALFGGVAGGEAARTGAARESRAALLRPGVRLSQEGARLELGAEEA